MRKSSDELSYRGLNKFIKFYADKEPSRINIIKIPTEKYANRCECCNKKYKTLINNLCVLCTDIKEIIIN